MQNKLQKSKGFTLAELAVALSVGAIVLAMLAVSVFYLHKSFSNSDYTNNSLAEFNQIKSHICSLSQDWIAEGFSVDVLDGETLVCVNAGQNVHKLQSKNSKLVLDDKEIIVYHYVASLKFIKEDNQTIVQIEFLQQEKMQFIV